MIELPSGPVVLEDRLALLEDPDLAERLFRENPALFAAEPPRTQREVLAWTTRKLGTALLAVTAVISIAAGYAVNELTRKHEPARAPAAVSVPFHRAQPASHVRTEPRPAMHVARHATNAAHHAATIVVAHPIAAARTAATHRTISPAQSAGAHVVVHHRAAVVAPAVVVHPAMSRELQAQRAKERARAAQAEQLRVWAAEQHAIAMRAAQRAAQARAAAQAEPAPQVRPRTEPASAVSTASGQATRTDTATTTTSPLDTAPPSGNAGVKNPTPTNPGGGWNERGPIQGTLGGVVGPILGTPRDSCTPRGGRVGIVMQAISILSQH
jgi:type II secretory pathway pseudopilin PulG